jgi:hypothetical protein
LLEHSKVDLAAGMILSPKYHSIIAAVFVFLISLVLLPYYTNGDLSSYKKVYEALPNFGLMEGLSFYTRNLNSSQEFIHFILSWIASRFIDKDLFIALSNATLAYVAMGLLRKWNTSIIVAYFIVLANFYLWVLYLPAERLKFGFIFLILSVMYLDKSKRFYAFTTLALISHIQVLVIYGSIVFRFLVKQAGKAFQTGRMARSVLFVIPFMLIFPLLIGNQVLTKFEAYYDERPLFELAKITVLLLLALRYSTKKNETVAVFFVLFVAVFLVGGDRLNMLGYFAFLYYALQFRGGWNFGVLTTSMYFTYRSAGFLVNVIQHGDGFFAG